MSDGCASCGAEETSPVVGGSAWDGRRLCEGCFAEVATQAVIADIEKWARDETRRFDDLFNEHYFVSVDEQTMRARVHKWASGDPVDADEAARLTASRFAHRHRREPHPATAVAYARALTSVALADLAESLGSALGRRADRTRRASAMVSADLRDHLEGELAAAREAAARAVDRVEALVALRSRAFTLGAAADAEGRTLEPDDLFEADDERERAELRALAQRAFPEDA